MALYRAGRPTIRTMSRPNLEFVALTRGIGVHCESVTTIEELNAALASGLQVMRISRGGDACLEVATGARTRFGGLVGGICGLVALALAIVAIFISINGILISCVASALAVVAALLGESRNSAGATIVIGVNSVLLSPVLWFTIVPPGQLVVAAFVACLVGAPFGAMALTQCVPQYRFAIVLSILWTLTAPAVVNGVAVRRANDATNAADVACYHSPHPPGTDVNKLCYDAGKQALDATPQPSHPMLTAVSLLPPALAWLGYWLVFARRRASLD